MYAAILTVNQITKGINSELTKCESIATNI